MSVVAIIGAGELGGALARTLAGRERVAAIHLIDDAAGIAAGKALDIRQAGPIEGADTRLVGMGDVSAASDADVIVIADRAGGPEPHDWAGEPGLALLGRVAAANARAPIVCAGAAQRELIERGVGELKIPRERLIGAAPGALASAARALVAIELNASPADVALSVVGVPPGGAVIPWGEATIGGHALARALDPPRLASIEARLRYLWPPGPYALASAAARVCEAIAGPSRRRFSCFVALDGELGVRARVSAVPVVLGPRGVARIIIPTLDTRERVLFDNALART